MLRACSRGVFSCFKALERFADRVTGVAGPFFVALAWALLSAGVTYFFYIIAPTLRFQIITIPICLLSAVNLLTHYYYACTISPGTPEESRAENERRGWNWARPRLSDKVGDIGRWSLNPEREGWVLVGERRDGMKCRTCHLSKPERSHHCRVCKSCILKYDHHCPVRINQCVGLHNERHFILFMAYLVLCCGFFVTLGYDKVWLALDFSPNKWTWALPQTFFVLIYVLALALGLAVSIMLTWHLYLISNAESTVENYDFARYRQVAQSRGTTFINSYDLGAKRNLALFFNIVPSGYPFYTLLLPLRCAPYTDGFSWARKPGYTKHTGIEQDDELTDEED